MEQKKLPIIYPPITSYPLYAALFSILSQNKKSLDWLYLNYIQILAYNLDNEHVWLDFYSKVSDGMCNPRFEACPFIFSYRIPRELIKMKWDKMQDFLIDVIDQGYYCYFYIDRKYITKYNIKYNESENLIYKHECLIYGYDKTNKTFDYADFFDGIAYKYTSISMAEVEKAYANFQSDFEYERFQGVYLLKIQNSEIIFNNNEILCSLLEYLGKRNAHYDLGVTTGINAHDKLKEYILYCSKNNICPDLRVFHMFFDHKSIIFNVTNIVSQITSYKRNECISLSKKNQEGALVIRNKILKCKISNNFKPLLELAEKIDDIKRTEKLYIWDMITGLRIHLGHYEENFID